MVLCGRKERDASSLTVLNHVFLMDWGTSKELLKITSGMVPPLHLQRGTLLMVRYLMSARNDSPSGILTLKQVNASVPADMAIHLVVDNYATHKHQGVKRLAAHPRYQVRYTPAYASWFNIITREPFAVSRSRASRT
jgi:DDE superfamily endonuclease